MHRQFQQCVAHIWSLFCSISVYAHLKLDNCPDLLIRPRQKHSLNGSRLVAAIQSTQTLARRQSSLVRRFVLFTRRCQTNLSGVPSPGQRWECIKTVKMAAVTGSWHPLHLVMMTKYDIPPFCPKMIISPLKSATGPLQLPLMNITPQPDASFAIYTRLWSSQPLLCLLSFTSTHRFSLSPMYQPSLLFCNHNPAILHLPFTLHSLSPLL